MSTRPIFTATQVAPWMERDGGTNVLVFDTETDGLAVNPLMKPEVQARLVEFYGLVLSQKVSGQAVSFTERHALGKLYCPDRWVTEEMAYNKQLLTPAGIQKITGLTQDELLRQPKFDTAAAIELKALIQHCDIVVAHNLSFDMAIIDNAIIRVGLSPPVWPMKICTVERTEWLTGKRLNLTDLHRYLFGVEFKDAHRAEPDTRALAEVYMELVRRDLL